MDRVVRKIATRIIAVHVALFLLLVVLVGFASREIYNSARQQASTQAEESQTLLVGQTARGIEAFYGGILAGLDLVRDAEDEQAVDDDAARTQPATTGAAKRLMRDPVGPRGLVVARLVARQLEGRASQVFVLDRRQMFVVPVGEPDPTLPPAKVTAQLGEWFKGVEGAQISPFKLLDGTGYNVAAVPARRNAHLMIVATVPVRAMAARLLDRLGSDGTVATLLADDDETVMAANERAWIGSNLRSLGGDFGSGILDTLGANDMRGTTVIDHPFHVGGVECPPSMFASEPVRVADKQWFVLVASDLAEVDAVVTNLVRRGVWWVGFVVLSMAALLASTSVQLIRYRVRLERERTTVLENELAHARQIQLAWLPHPTPDADGCNRVDVAAVNQPASHVSGDFYNWFDLPDGRKAVVIGDVTGHGLPAAFLMATVQLLVRNTLPQTLDPGRCLTSVNRQLCVQVFHGQFVTMQVMVVDCENGKLSVANAGHPPPLMGNGDAAFSPLKVDPQLVLGIQPDVDYPTQHFDMSPGSAVLLYTDGVVDAVGVDGTRFDAERLSRSLTGQRENAAGLVQAVIDAVNDFRGGHDLVDDLTLVAVHVQGSVEPTEGEVAAEAAAV
jgi:serine phosphatase RsbU (regulator of sigma subunit)